MARGLVHAVRLDGGGGMRWLAEDEALSAQVGEGVLWLHFDYTDEQAQQWVEKQSGLAPPVADALLTLETRPRVASGNDSLLVYLRGVNLAPGADPEDMIAIRLWVEAGRIISTQRRGLMSVRDILDSLEQGAGPRSAGAIIADLVDRLTWYMEDVIAQIEGRVAEFDGVEVQQDIPPLRRRVMELRRQAIVLRRYLAPQRDALARLHTDTSSLLNDADRLIVREAADRLQRLLEDLDMFRDHASIAQEEMDSRLSQQLNQRLYVLAIITGMFLPLGFLTGLFGVNLGGIPGADSSYAFALFVGTLTLLLMTCGALLYRRKWF